MPTYEYRCKDCGQHVEVVQSFKDDPLTECPNCGGQLRKVFGNVGIAFKGSGFYKTDSRSSSSSSSKAGSSESGSGGSSSSSDAKSSDSKSSDSKSSDSKSSDSKSSDSKSSDSSGGGKREAKSA
ncbi:MAG: regulatory protein FmdB family [Acidimicrobiales bacterium]|jgi:putative FmdB family regulatory protein|nr:regulatory protein FmdB family [Acidimicrobiales bacterium]